MYSCISHHSLRIFIGHYYSPVKVALMKRALARARRYQVLLRIKTNLVLASGPFERYRTSFLRPIRHTAPVKDSHNGVRGDKL